MSKKLEKSCSNCKNQYGGFDGGFFGLPLTCECRVFGETENRKDCKEWEKRITKNDLLNEIANLRKENEQLQKENKEMRHELDSLSGCYCADNKEFKEYWRIGYE